MTLYDMEAKKALFLFGEFFLSGSGDSKSQIWRPGNNGMDTLEKMVHLA
jgi:hypothetical protein